MIRVHLFCVFCALLFLVSVSTVAGELSSNSVPSEDTEISTSQISIDSITIVCGEGTATVHVMYSLTDVTHFLFIVFGSSSLERSISEMLGFTDATVVSVGAGEAELILSDIATVYGDGIYWLPAHTFQNVIPIVEVVTPQETFTYHDTMDLAGIAYYAPEGSLDE